MKNLLIFTLSLLTLFMAGCRNKQATYLASPNGHIVFYPVETSDGFVKYTVSANGYVVLEPSSLGLMAEGFSFTDNLRITSISGVRSKQESYRLVTGKQLLNEATCNERTYTITNDDGNEMDLQVRAYDDGIAFRYRLNSTAGKTVHVVSEQTSFNLPQPGKAWMHPYDAVTQWAPGYETYYTEVATGEAAPADKNGWAFPALFEVNGSWVLISEAGHDGSYPAMHLDADPATGNYTLRLPEPEETYNNLPATKPVATPFDTPWRAIAIAGSLAGIVETNLITHLTDPSKLEDTSWIRPGRSSWSWWSDNDSPKDFEKLKRFIDFSAEMGWEYSLVDANWNIMQGGDLKGLAEYAATKGVGLLVWYNSGGAHNIVTEMPRDRMWDADTRRAEFQQLQQRGIRGIKVDFFQSDKPDIIRQYIGILEDAAEFELLVNFHGCTLPKGWRRTYPNLVTMESIRGGECYIFAGEYPENAPVHLNIATYTRNVVGPMDYTPVGLSYLKHPHLTTFAFELAQGVVFESGIQHLSDDPDAYRALPDFAIEYLKNLPVVWDETKFLDGYPGDYTVIARRSGGTWYVGGINGLDTAVSANLDLSFLPGGARELQLMTGNGKEGLDMQLIDISGKENLVVDMEPLSGFVGWVIVPR